MARIVENSRVLALVALAAISMVPDATMATTWHKSYGEVTSLGFRDADQRISYGPSDQQFVELWLPSNTDPAAAVVALIHGGCWLAEYDISHIAPLASALAENGYAVWGIEYRRVGQEGGGWPGTFQDIAAAMDRLSTFRDPRVDTDRAVVVGHSAGGHLALWAAGRSRLAEDQELYRRQPFEPLGAIGLAAIADLGAYAEGENSCQEVTPRLMGGPPSGQPERYRQSSPALLGADVPVILLQGDADRIVPRAQARSLPTARTVILEGAGHFDLIHPGTPAFPTLLGLLHELTGQ